MKFIAVAAASLDGFITQGDQPGAAFTSQADKEWFSKAMKSFRVKIMGRKTFAASKAFIQEQTRNSQDSLRYILTRNPERFHHIHIPGRLEFTDKDPADLVARLRNELPDDTQIAVLGGGNIYSAFLNQGLLDEFWITLEPQLFGSGTPIVSEAVNKPLKLKESTQLGPSTLLLKYLC